MKPFKDPWLTFATVLYSANLIGWFIYFMVKGFSGVTE